MEKRKVLNNILFIIAISLTFVLLFNKYESRDKVSELNQLIESLGDSLEVWRDKDSVSYARISVLETARVNDFLLINSKDEEIIALQKEVDRYKQQIKDQGSVTTIVTEIRVDTSWVFVPPSGDTVILSESIILDSLKDDWIDVTFGFVKGLSVLSINNIRNEYTVAVGREGQGLFKPSRPFVELTSYNPHTRIQSVRSYQVSIPKQDRWGLGIIGGYGFQVVNNTGVNHGFIIGAGINYNLITW